MLLNFRQPNVHILEKVVSWTGKYMGFYGIHYERNKPCHVVGASNRETGEIVMRHYNDTTCINEEAAIYAARKYWEETFKPGLLKRVEWSEEDERRLEVERLLERSN